MIPEMDANLGAIAAGVVAIVGIAKAWHTDYKMERDKKDRSEQKVDQERRMEEIAARVMNPDLLSERHKTIEREIADLKDTLTKTLPGIVSAAVRAAINGKGNNSN